MFHPNIYADGAICLDILQNQWSPIYDIAAILTSIQSLLSDPNPASPANAEASQLFERDRREYNRRVKVLVEESWLEGAEGEDQKAGAAEAEVVGGTTTPSVFAAASAAAALAAAAADA